MQSRGWAAGWCAVKGSGFRNKSGGSSPPQRLRETAEAELVACISRSGLQTISEQKCKSLNQGRPRSWRAEVGGNPSLPLPLSFHLLTQPANSGLLMVLYSRSWVLSPGGWIYKAKEILVGLLPQDREHWRMNYLKLKESEKWQV